MTENLSKKIGIFSTVGLGLSTMIGSGWLFASYYATKSAGPASILSWIIGAIIVLTMAFMLAQIACVYHERGLFTKLTTLSHGSDFGFVTAISNWFVGIIVVPSEAIATIQFISTIYPSVTHTIFHAHQLTFLGVCLVGLLLLGYLLLNYWGIRLLIKFNNSLTIFKVVLPIVTAFIIIFTAFHASNFHLATRDFVPFGLGSIFSTIVTSGIFYAFFGFQTIVSFASELNNPKKNIPIALILCVLIVLGIYLFLQIAFIGALPTNLVAKGWQNLYFASPLAQLSILLGLNLLAMVLYIDAAISPSGTGVIYLGASTRMLTAMSHHGQFPRYFSQLSQYYVSRRSLLFTFIFCLAVVFLFRNWQNIAMFTTTFILVSCFALSIAYTKLRRENKLAESTFKLKYGELFSLLVYLFITYLFFQLPFLNLFIMLIIHIVFFSIYAVLQSGYRWTALKIKIKNTWSIFIYFLYITLFVKLNTFYHISQANIFIISLFEIIIPIVLFYSMINQKEYTTKKI